MTGPGPRRGPRGFAGLALVAAVLAVSWSAILVRLCDAPGVAIAFYRLGLSTLIVLPFGLRGGRPVPRRVAGSALVAGLLLALHFATWISSLSYTSVASSVVLVSTQPVFTAVLAPLLLGERADRRGWLAVTLALAGTAVLAGGDWQLGPQAVIGDLLALAGGLTASLYLMIGRRVRAAIPFSRYLLLVYGSGAAALGAMDLLSGIPLAGYPTLTWLWIALIALGPNVTGHTLLNWSVRRMRALTVNLAILGEPILATLYAVVLFRELPPPTFYLGGTLIAGGIALAMWSEFADGRTAPGAPASL